MYLFVRAEELVDDTFGEGMFFKQTWDSSIHQWIVLEEGYYNDEVVGYCSAQIKQEGLLGILKTSVVRPDRQRHGIGDAMVKHRIKVATRAKCSDHQIIRLVHGWQSSSAKNVNEQ